VVALRRRVPVDRFGIVAITAKQRHQGVQRDFRKTGESRVMVIKRLYLVPITAV